MAISKWLIEARFSPVFQISNTNIQILLMDTVIQFILFPFYKCIFAAPCSCPCPISFCELTKHSPHSTAAPLVSSPYTSPDSRQSNKSLRQHCGSKRLKKNIFLIFGTICSCVADSYRPLLISKQYVIFTQ